MKYLFFSALLLMISCKSVPDTQVQQAPMAPRKAAFAERLLSRIYTLHFDINTPHPEPSKIEETNIEGWQGEKNDTIQRVYYYENGRLLKVLDNEFGGNSTYIFKYDDKGRRILIDQQTPGGSFHKDTFEYHPDKPFQAVRQHFMFNKSEDKLYFFYRGNSDTMEVRTYDGTDMYYFRELNDTLFVEMTWRDFNGNVLANKIEAYDKHNRLVKLAMLEKGRVDRTIIYTYDERGNEVSRVEQDTDNTIGGSAGVTAISNPQSYYTSYQYDEKGNWTMKVEKNETGRYKSVTKRKIVYAR
jgi:hypothetical protein